MRVPLSWLRDFAPLEGEVDHLARSLSELGLVVDGVERVGRSLDGIVTSRVIATRQHPDADRIQLVDVDAGDGDPLQVACGAFNFAAGDIVPLARVGTTMPEGMVIARRKMRGQWSEGMLCSARELGLSDDHDGILVLPAGTAVGVPLKEALGIGADVVFDLDVTPNRPDAMSVAGVARDLAAKLKVPFAIPEPPVPVAVEGPVATLRVEAVDLCPRFTVQVLTGVRVGPSPRWLAGRLTLAGMRPINNLVDISNYVMLELGQPNHAYDLDRLPGGGLLVGRGRPGEVVVTLDAVERAVGPDDCIIRDAGGEAVGIGAVMGGASSEISDDTTSVLLETAYFDPIAVARTSKRLGLRTEASARFERGVDREGIERSARRFCQLACDVAGAAAVGDLLVEGGVLPPPVQVCVRTSRVNSVLGVALTTDDVRVYLEPIGFRCADAGDDAQQVTIPSWRPDSEREIDVIEEVARHHGYERIARTMPASVGRIGGMHPYQQRRRFVRDVMAGAGLSEAWSTSLLAPADLERAGLRTDGAVRLANPMVKEESVLRTSMLPGLLRAVAHNQSRRNPGVTLFEIGHVFGAPTGADALPVEAELLAAVLAEHDARGAKRVWDTLLDTLAVDAAGVDLVAGEVDGLHPTRTARIVHPPTGGAFGAVGEVDPDVLGAHGISQRVGWVHVDLGWLLALPGTAALYTPVSRFPSSDIDLAFVVPDAVPAADVERGLRDAGGALLVDVALFDVYRGPPLEAGTRSLAFRLRFNAPDRTLTDAEVAEARSRCIAAVESVGGRLR